MLKNIPVINENFDPYIFATIVKKSIWICIVILVLSVIIATLYMRYTPFTFKSVSVIQINEVNQTDKLLQIQPYEQTELSNKIELLRSKEFLKRTFNKLPLSVKYYLKGTFLSSEQYRTSPYQVQVKINQPSIYEIPIYIDFSDNNNFTLEYKDGSKTQSHKFITDAWNPCEWGEIYVSLNNYQIIKDQKNMLKPNQMFFVLKDPQKILDENIKNLSIEVLNSSAKTIQIIYSNHNAAKTSEVVNTIAEEYIKYDVEKKRESSQNILNFIEDQLRVVYKNLDQTEKELHEFKKENKLGSEMRQTINSPFPLFTTKINEFETEILNIEFELATLRRINTQIEKGQNLNIFELIALLSGTKSGQIVVSILNNLQSLMNQREQMLTDVTANNLKIKIIEKQIDNQKELLKDFVGSTIARLSGQSTDFKNKIEEYEKKLFSESSYKEVEYNKLERLYSINEGFYHKLIEKKAENMISQAGFVSQNEILERAAVPNEPLSPIKSKIYTLYFTVALFLCLLIILTRYLFYNEITSVNNIKPYTDCPILGTVPKYKRKIPISQLLVNHMPNSMFTESFRAIRSNLQFISNTPGSKIVAVSSTISGEGKTFVAINLAGILAISGKKVLLLDLDLRKPRVHLGFSSENTIGVSTILIGLTPFEDCITKTELDNFHYITAGPVPPNPNELILGQAMKDLVEKAREMYDVVIIDTPPIGIVTDALSHFQIADYPIYVMKAGFSKRSFIQNINLLIKTKNLTNMGIVLNYMELERKSYGYGYGNYGYGNYSYGYGYGYYDEEHQEKKPWYKKIKFKTNNKI